MRSSIRNANTIPAEIKIRRRKNKRTAMHTAEDEKDKSRKVNDISVEESDVSRHFKSAGVCGSECVLSKEVQDRVYKANPRSTRLTSNH